MQQFGKVALRVAKNYTKGYSDTQVKVREATSNDPWGPSGTQMNEIAQLTYNQNDFVEIMEMLDKRLNDRGKNWRHVFKSLTVLDYCLHQGSENVVIYFRDNIYVIKTLKEFQYIEEDGKDQGANVRQKAKDITNLLLDEARLRQERSARASMRDRMIRGVTGGDYDDNENEGERNQLNDQRRPNNDDEELRRAIESKKSLAQEAEERDLQWAIKLSEEEEQQRRRNNDDEELRRAIESEKSLAQEAEERDLQWAIKLSEEEQRRNKAVDSASLFGDQNQLLAPQSNNLFPNPSYSQFNQLPPPYTAVPQFTSFNPYQQQLEHPSLDNSILKIYFDAPPLSLTLADTSVRMALQKFYKNHRPDSTESELTALVHGLADMLKDETIFRAFCEILLGILHEHHSFDNDEIHVILVTIPSGGFIHPFSDQAKLDVSLICDTETLRNQLRADNPWVAFTSLPPLWVPLVAELLQIEVCSTIEPDYRKKCLACLRKLVRHFTELPPSFFLHDVVKDGAYPVAKGGFADIWKGRVGQQVVCIKVLRTYRSGQDFQKAFKAFAHEAIIWKQLRHSNVLPFLGVKSMSVMDDGHQFMNLWLISPWMANGNVNTFLEKNPNHDRLSCILQVVAGLRYLHNLQMVHGDLRGANILVSNDGECCLADFGLSVISESQTFSTTTTSSVKGSIRWLAPEVIDPPDTPPLPTARDIYALACTILELYTGSAPFLEIKNDATVIYKILAGAHPARPQTGESISDALWNLLLVCWQQDPSKRPTLETIEESLQT